MFQSFETEFSGATGPERLGKLRAAMARIGVDGFIVPRTDMFQGEYVAPGDERLAWLTGFSGSAGFAVAMGETAAIFVDGRYRIQVRQQVDPVFEPVDWPETTLAQWIADRAAGQVIAYDPWLHTVDEIAKLAQSGAELRPVANLIDPLWQDRPAAPTALFFAQPDELAGESAASKRHRLAEGLKSKGQRAAVITLTDSVAWLLNIRGADIAHNPVPQAYAILHDDGRCDLFCRPEKTAEIADHLGAEVTVHGFDRLTEVLGQLPGPVRIDPSSCPQVVAQALTAAGVTTVEGQDPCVLPKAIKNPVELDGMRAAHRRDAIAMCRFLAWMAQVATTGITEIDVVERLEQFRRDTNALREISFDTISGTGPNGAVIHYRVTHDSNRTLADGDLIVVDSGGQYVDGTTDITRTLAVGTVGEEERRCYTQVLRGVIAISRARFPVGVAGAHLDALARQFLWADGLDYDHGTGHGVGAYLCVHEGPQRISRLSTLPLEPGMILSNEPGYYRPGAFGIRIENLIAVCEAPALPGGDAHRKYLGFETLTWVPLDRRLIDAGLMSRDEVAWVDEYHRIVLDKLVPDLDAVTQQWVTAACAPL